MEAMIKSSADLHLGFDVGHSSIGWAVVKAEPDSKDPELLGTGVVTFGSDDCLASKRRIYRRQRRHVRATRQRVARLEKLIVQLGVLSAEEIKAKHRQAGGDSAPWFLAARVLASQRTSPALTWVQLWDVIRWYVHNRGYDGNRRWSMVDGMELGAEDDSKKEQNAIALMQEHGTTTMAETFVRVLGLDINDDKRSSGVRFKAMNAAFPRRTVENEVRWILDAHRGRLAAIDDEFIATLFEDWRAIPVPGLELPARYQGGLLFGQLVPRFDNRIISTCPISGAKVPSRNSSEFLYFRWAMQLANVQVGAPNAPNLRPLSPAERRTLDNLMRVDGRLTKHQFKIAVRALPGVGRDNLDALLMHPDAEEALVVDPVTQLVRSDSMRAFWESLSPRVQKRARDTWRRGKSLSLAELRALALKLGESVDVFDRAVTARVDAANTRKRKKDTGVTADALLAERFAVRRLAGRAAYARPLLVQAYKEVMRGKHPKEAEGCLYLDETKRREQLAQRIEDQSNNHLVRHRLMILERLLHTLIADPRFADGVRSRVARISIEVNRELRELSGKTAKEIEQDLGLRLSNHKKVSEKLERAFSEQVFNGKRIDITAGLIRKARVAEDLGWVCPYTGVQFEPVDLISRRVDKDHIVPRSARPSDSLDSLVITFSEINKWKGNRTAWQFVHDEQGKPVPGRPNLSIRSLIEYAEWVAGLETFKGHPDDKRRKKNRRTLLLLPTYLEKTGGFLPGDLTQTSQLVRLGAQVLARHFSDLAAPPPVASLPGSITATVRRSWNLLGCLSLASPQVLELDGSCKTKTEIRGITHLHHALDACVLVYASLLLPRDGGIWELMIKRAPNDAERATLKATGWFDFDAEGRFGLRDLPNPWKEQIRRRLAEKRVVQHVPADMGGLRVEENTRGVERVENGRVYLHQRSPRDPKTGQSTINLTHEPIEKVVGLAPLGGHGKLKPLNGVRVITDNFGIALLDHVSDGEEKFAIIPWHKVWHRIAELEKRNGGKRPRLLRNGMLIQVPQGTYKGTWVVFSAKNNASGMAVDIGWPDVVRLKNKTPGHKINVSLRTLLRDGLQLLPTVLSGHPQL